MVEVLKNYNSTGKVNREWAQIMADLKLENKTRAQLYQRWDGVLDPMLKDRAVPDEENDKHQDVTKDYRNVELKLIDIYKTVENINWAEMIKKRSDNGGPLVFAGRS